MFRKNKPIVATPEDPFGQDRLNRRPHIETLTDKIMPHTETPLVMCMSSPWGSGKTSFVTMWKAYLESKEHKCLTINAWEHDFHKEPMLVILGELGEFIEQNTEPTLKKKCQKAFKNVAQKAAPILSILSPIAAMAALACPGAGTVAAAGTITAKAIADATKQTSDLAKALVEYGKTGHSEIKKQLREFKTELSTLVKTIQGQQNKPVYIFIDELDRCEPTYAIKLLEAIKHLFDIDGIVFILSIDKDQLSSMASTRYGAHFDADGYLRRFIDLEYTIPKPELKGYLIHLIQDVYCIEKISSDEAYMDSITTEVSSLCSSASIPARTIERAFTKAHIALQNEEERRDICSYTIKRNDQQTLVQIERDSLVNKKYMLWHELILSCAILKEHNSVFFNTLIEYGHTDPRRIEGKDFFNAIQETHIGKALVTLISPHSRIESATETNATEYAALILNQNNENPDNRVLKGINQLLSLTDNISFPSSVHPKGIESAAQVGTPTVTYR